MTGMPTGSPERGGGPKGDRGALATVAKPTAPLIDPHAEVERWQGAANCRRCRMLRSCLTNPIFTQYSYVIITATIQISQKILINTFFKTVS